MNYTPATRVLPPLPALPAAAPGHSPQARVLLLDEPIELAPPQGVPLGFRPSLLSQLLAAGSADERRRTVSALLHGLGFDWLGYGQTRQAGDRVVPTSFCTTYANARWTERYFQQHYEQVDPRLQQTLRSALPYVWTVDTLRQQRAASGGEAQLARFVDDLRATGTRSGVMLTLPGPGTERAYVSLLSCAEGADWIDDAVLGRVLTLGMCLHEFYSRYVPLPAAPEAPPAAAPVLSPLQTEILALLAKGLGDKQIADRLNLSLHNVDYHLRRLRQRFGVRNRVQLMQAATRGSGGGAAA